MHFLILTQYYPPEVGAPQVRLSEMAAAPQRDTLAVYLKEHGIGTMVYYPVPLHRQEVYASLSYGEGSLPASEAASREVLSLPMYPELIEMQQASVAGALREFYGR